MSSLEFWSGIIILVLTQVFVIIRDHRAAKSAEPLTNAQKEEVLSEAMERLGQEYSRMIGVNRALEEELNALRPLTLKIALQEQEMKQVKTDKEDWKRYAEKLVEQLQANSIVPLPFRRLPPNGDSDKMRAITQDVLDVLTKKANTTGTSTDTSAVNPK